MSTKIYSAYKYNGDIEQLKADLKQIRKEYFDKTYSSLKDIFLKSYDPKKDEDRVKTIFDFQKLIEEAMSKGYVSELSPEANAVVYFQEGKIYVQFFIGRWDEPENLPERFVDYHYQNQTDQPEEINDEEWEEREETWDKILEEEDIPSLAGFTYEIFSKPHVSNVIMKLIDDTRSSL